jgi:hypothetical protein
MTGEKRQGILKTERVEIFGHTSKRTGAASIFDANYSDRSPDWLNMKNPNSRLAQDKESGS